MPNSPFVTLPPNFSNTLSINIHFPSLSTSSTPCLCFVQRRWYNYSFIIIIISYRHYAFMPNPVLLSKHFSAPHVLYSSFILCTTSISHPPSATTCYPRYLKQSTSSNDSPFSPTSIRPTFAYIEHLITLLGGRVYGFSFSIVQVHFVFC